MQVARGGERRGDGARERIEPPASRPADRHGRRASGDQREQQRRPRRFTGYPSGERLQTRHKRRRVQMTQRIRRASEFVGRSGGRIDPFVEVIDIAVGQTRNADSRPGNDGADERRHCPRAISELCTGVHVFQSNENSS